MGVEASLVGRSPQPMKLAILARRADGAQHAAGLKQAVQHARFCIGRESTETRWCLIGSAQDSLKSGAMLAPYLTERQQFVRRRYH